MRAGKEDGEAGCTMGKAAYLRAIGVGAGVGHGQQARLVVLQVEVLVGELLAVDGLSTSALSGDVSVLRSV